MDKAQPALFVIGYALARMWMARGVQPVSMLGHSLGEYVAACLAGVFELPHALSIVAARGRLLQSLPQGAMTSVPLAEAELQSLLDWGFDLGDRKAHVRTPVTRSSPIPSSPSKQKTQNT